MNCHQTAKNAKQSLTKVGHTSVADGFGEAKRLGSATVVLGTEGVLSFCGDIGLASKLQAVSQNLMMQGLGWS